MLETIVDLCMKSKHLIRQGRQLLLKFLQVLETYKLPFEYEERVRLDNSYEVLLCFGGKDGAYFRVSGGQSEIISAASLSQPSSGKEDKYIILALKSLPEHLKRLRHFLMSQNSAPRASAFGSA
ncbi:MAG: hypothetical protein QW512_05485, partial [Thermofilaceae archaeon]